MAPRYRGRFAPTPSGPLHFGSMIAAIGSYCDARAHGGDWHVRIDDIDTPRVVSGCADDILRTLEQFALEWDGYPVYESHNIDAYHSALHTLRVTGSLFACACSRQEVARSSIIGIDGPIYPGTCRDGLPPGRSGRALRLRVNEGTTITFDDLLQGQISQDLATAVGDFVIYRADGIFSYHLTCAVGDAHQQVTHIVRGADLVDSTPRQVHLQHLLHLATPAYLHLPVATNARGEKLSKQTHAAPVDAAQAAPTIYAVLRFLGQQPPQEMVRWSAVDAMQWAVSAWRRDNVPPLAAIEITSPNR